MHHWKAPRACVSVTIQCTVAWAIPVENIGTSTRLIFCRDDAIHFRSSAARGRSLCQPWELATFPSPDERPQKFRVLFYTCAGGHDAMTFLPSAVRAIGCCGADWLFSRMRWLQTAIMFTGICFHPRPHAY